MVPRSQLEELTAPDETRSAAAAEQCVELQVHWRVGTGFTWHAAYPM